MNALWCIGCRHVHVLLLLLGTSTVPSCRTEDSTDTISMQRGIPFAVWLREASLDTGAYDAYAFIMDGTCAACQKSLDSAATITQRSIIYVSSDFATVQRYLRQRIPVYYDSTRRMQYLDVLHHKTTVVFPTGDSLKQDVMVLEPETLDAILQRFLSVSEHL